jgi:oligoendopeptidase F
MQRRLDAAAGGADAFTHPADGRPFVRAPYRSGFRDALTLAHEFGHSAHQAMAWAGQGVLHVDIPEPLAETIATLTERLAGARLLRQADDVVAPRMRDVLMEDAISRSLRMLVLHRFETEVLDLLEVGGQADADALNAIWLRHHRALFSPAMAFGDGFGPWWMLEPLLHRQPLCAIAYPFAMGAASQMLVYLDDYGLKRFQRGATDLMREGAGVPVMEALRRFGLEEPGVETWQTLLGHHFDSYR